MRLKQYWQRYREVPRQLRVFFWTVLLFFLIIIVPTVWSYARLYYARTQISVQEEKSTPNM